MLIFLQIGFFDMATPTYSTLAQQFRLWLDSRMHEVTADAKEVKVYDRRTSAIVRLPFAATSFPVSRTSSNRQG